MKSECILINQKIFSFTNDDNVYVGNLGMDYSFFTEKIIFYHNLEAKKEIINIVQNNNFNYFNYLLFSGDLISNGFNIQMLNLNYQKSIYNAFIIEKLKDFINFEIYIFYHYLYQQKFLHPLKIYMGIAQDITHYIRQFNQMLEFKYQSE